MREISYDAAKEARNIAERGISFALARDMDFDTAVFREDERVDYGAHPGTWDDRWSRLDAGVHDAGRRDAGDKPVQGNQT